MHALPEVPIHRTAERRRYGEPVGALARLVADGTFARLRRGAYVDSAEWKSLTREAQHLMLVVATAMEARKVPTFSHESAAVLWRLPIVEGLPDRVQTTVPPGLGLRSNKVVERHESTLRQIDVRDVEGFRVTTIERTFVDFASRRSFLSGACAAEHLLHSGSSTRELLEAATARRKPFKGSKKVEAVVRFASTASASPNETLCRVRFDQLGFPQPAQQREYTGSLGQTFAVDFYWPDYDVIGEADGRIKYRDHRYLAGRTPEQALWDEKQREDDLRSQCSGFLRLTWDDAWHRTGLVAKLARAGIPRHR